MSETDSEFLDSLKKVLNDNDRGDFTIPAGQLYEHQWLWDSCFIAIGLSHYDIPRAKAEILHLLKGQWSNGMMPNIVFRDQNDRDTRFWQSQVSSYAPEHTATSGITQPPLIAEAVQRIGQKLSKTERREWYYCVFKQIVAFHEWLYNERDPHSEGLVILVHPWESGLDNSPVWTKAMLDNTLPWWIRLITKMPVDFIINKLRRDTRFIRSSQRSSTLEIMVYHHVQQRLRAKTYDSERILLRSHFQLQDLAFNSILIRNNHILIEIANELNEELPEKLVLQMKKADESLTKLWDEQKGSYFSRNFITHKLTEEESIMNFMPLYAGIATEEQKNRLVSQLKNNHWNSAYPVPSVPINSTSFNQERYWQGPSWINTNWLIIDGLVRCGETELANMIKKKSIELVKISGSYEYFNPITGEPLGAPNFSWTAALIIDLMKSKQ